MTISYGTNLGLMVDAATGEAHADDFRSFLRGVDCLAMPSVLDKDLNTPPSTPTTGDRYLVGSVPTGAWVGNAGKIARWAGAAWEFYTPRNGWSVLVVDEGVEYRYLSGVWAAGLKIGNGTASTSTTTGDLVIAGGAGIGGSIFVGGGANFSGTVFAPTIAGGTQDANKVTIKGTSGNGTLTSVAVEIAVGNNGATSALTVLNNGYFGFGRNDPDTAVYIQSDSVAPLTIEANGTSLAPNFISRRSRGSKSAKSAVQTNDILLNFSAQGYGATGYSTAALGGFRVYAAENFTDSAMGSYAQIRTSAIGATTSSVRVHVTDAGFVGIGGITAPAQLLELSGAAALDGSTPTVLRISGLGGGSTFTVGGKNSGVEFYNNDSTGGGAGVRTSIFSCVENTVGSNWGLAFATATANATASTKFYIANDGRAVFGVDVAATNAVADLTVASTSTSSPRGILSMQFSNSTDGARVGFSKARGTIASPTAVLSGDMLGRLMYRGLDASGNYLEMGSIACTTVGTVGAGRIPTKLVFSTGTDAATSVLTDALVLDQNQDATFTRRIITPKAPITDEGGYAVKVVAGEQLYRGEVVYIKQTGGADGKVWKAPAGNEMPVGVVFADAAADAEVWIVKSGLAYVLPESGKTAARGYVIFVSASEAGRVDLSATAPGVEHWRECGHFLDTGSGNGALTRAFIHFN